MQAWPGHLALAGKYTMSSNFLQVGPIASAVGLPGPLGQEVILIRFPLQAVTHCFFIRPETSNWNSIWNIGSTFSGASTGPGSWMAAIFGPFARILPVLGLSSVSVL